MIVKAEELTVAFGGVEVLSNVSFSAENDAVQITDIVQRLKDEIGSRTAGVFHQAQVAHLILDRILLDLFHLFGGYDPHTVISFLY